MENKDQPAYPNQKIRFVSLEGTTYYDDTKLGLTKRELIAAMAMQGILATDLQIEYGDYGKKRTATTLEIAHWSAQHADALLAELSKQQP